tara:strand:+ start:249 stop:419 length:171 start_codon:yes stop_codon:yes gene_type:complete
MTLPLRLAYELSKKRKEPKDKRPIRKRPKPKRPRPKSKDPRIQLKRTTKSTRRKGK